MSLLLLALLPSLPAAVFDFATCDFDVSRGCIDTRDCTLHHVCSTTNPPTITAPGFREMGCCLDANPRIRDFATCDWHVELGCMNSAECTWPFVCSTTNPPTITAPGVHQLGCCLDPLE
ncbi:hypothetical protein PMAYCL1PPCAC_09195 [Pristionchus mayeri]|uniref:Secreted protein n=1 Tax=Pristionchus mayeri TaxID=1317129 RepID=A0AAN4ZL65_9BILA|nr:hypothetical protein PMAYCL1PPCAC_09195 [Pristionchus mayeri]